MSDTARRRAFKWGLKAETLAAWWLRLKGFRILESRYRTPVGEIDLIARRGKLMIFVEVKARASHAAGLEAVTPRQRERIGRAAAHYLRRGPYNQVRFDVITIVPGQRPRHWANAWSQ